MDVNKIIKNVILGASALIGFAVAEGVYRAGISTINKRELIGDSEIISEEIEEIDPALTDENIPF